MGRPTMPRKATIKHDRPKKHDEEMLTREFTDQEIMEFREAFAMFDIDGGGKFVRMLCQKSTAGLFSFLFHHDYC